MHKRAPTDNLHKAKLDSAILNAEDKGASIGLHYYYRFGRGCFHSEFAFPSNRQSLEDKIDKRHQPWIRHPVV